MCYFHVGLEDQVPSDPPPPARGLQEARQAVPAVPLVHLLLSDMTSQIKPLPEKSQPVSVSIWNVHNKILLSSDYLNTLF
jgi:hypothetical protein